MIWAMLGGVLLVLILLGLFWEFIRDNYIWLIPFAFVSYFAYDMYDSGGAGYETLMFLLIFWGVISIPIVILQYKKNRQIDKFRATIENLHAQIEELEKHTIKGKAKNAVADAVGDMIKSTIRDAITG